MTKKLKNISLMTVPFMGLALPGAAHAGGFYLQEQSIRGAGRAFSGEVADQGPQSLWWNPAAIGGQEGGAAAVGVSVILPRGNLDNIGTAIIPPGGSPTPVGGSQRSRNPIDNGVLPSGAVSYGITPQIAVGLSVTSPYSFATNYDATSWARYTARKTDLRTYDIQPSVAVMVLPQLSVGAALNVEYSDATLSNSLPPLVAGMSDGFQELKGNGWDLGWTVGAQFRSGPLTLGAAYKSKVRHKLSGTVTTTGLPTGFNSVINADATFYTPWQATFGARLAVTPRLTLDAQAVRTGWSEFAAIQIGSPINLAMPENYRDTWTFAGGVDYALTPALTVRAGVQHDQTPTQNGQRDARVPDSDRWNFATGASYAVTRRFTIDAAAAYIKFDNASIDRTTAVYVGTAAQTPILVNGQINDAHAIVLSLGGRVTF